MYLSAEIKRSTCLVTVNNQKITIQSIRQELMSGKAMQKHPPVLHVLPENSDCLIICLLISLSIYDNIICTCM